MRTGARVFRRSAMIARCECTIEWIKAHNQKVIEGFRRVGEQMILIDDDYEKSITEILYG